MVGYPKLVAKTQKQKLMNRNEQKEKHPQAQGTANDHIGISPNEN